MEHYSQICNPMKATVWFSGTLWEIFLLFLGGGLLWFLRNYIKKYNRIFLFI